jgi:hypothetical protein
MKPNFGEQLPIKSSKPSALERLAGDSRNKETGWLPDSLDALEKQEQAQYFYDLLITARQARLTGDHDGAEETLGQIKAMTEGFPESVELFRSMFARARTEQIIIQHSPLFQDIRSLQDDIEALRSEYGNLKAQVFTGQKEGIASKKNAESRLGALSQEIVALEAERAKNVDLTGYEHTREYTDVAALESYETLRRYHKQAEEGFAWLPSRELISQAILAALKNGRFPLLVGEPGTGKSEQADAVAKSLTGESCVKVACTSATGEHDLILEKQLAGGTSFESYGAVTQAFTGYETSLDKEPHCQHGRLIRFDEFLKINFDKTFGLIKEIGQKKPGDRVHQKVNLPVLAGSGIIATTNPAGSRHHLEKMLPALEREFAEIKVPYLPMEHTNPELYEFMLATLMDNKGYIALSKDELAPGYQEQEIVGEQLTADGRRILREQVIVTDKHSSEHGALYRLAFAVKALQDSYVAHNPDERASYEETLLRLDETGNVNQSGSGEALTLESSTLTLKEIASWMRGFAHRYEETNQAMHVATLAQWLAYKANIFIGQSAQQDQEKLESIFRHFGILDPQVTTLSKKPMTHVEIGYLSPRVPRPLVVEGQVAQSVDLVTATSFRDRTLASTEYVTVTGESIRGTATETVVQHEGEEFPIQPNQIIRLYLSEKNSNDMPQKTMTEYGGLTDDNKIILKLPNGLVQSFTVKELENQLRITRELPDDLCNKQNVLEHWIKELCPAA